MFCPILSEDNDPFYCPYHDEESEYYDPTVLCEDCDLTGGF